MWKNPCLIVDAYKLGHYFMMPKGVSFVYSGWTARSNRYMPNSDATVVFGAQYFVKEYLLDFFNKEFFQGDIDFIQKDFEKKVTKQFNPAYADFSRFRALYDLGYLPIEVMGLPEGTLCPIRVPDHVIFNTHPDFAWLPQYLEDLWSCHNWMPSTCATIAYDRRQILQKFVDLTCDNTSITPNLAGDFSLRGTGHEEVAYINGAGHLLSFNKTATIDTNGLLEQYYGADIENDIVGQGTPSLEHSVVCESIASYVKLLQERGEYKGIRLADYPDVDIKLVAEMCYIKYLLTEVQPKGVLSYVADTYDYWGVLTWILPKIKDDIVNRDGVFVVRPDSGDPTAIVCGYKIYTDLNTALLDFENGLDLVRRGCLYDANTGKFQRFESDGKGLGLAAKELMQCEVDGSIKVLADTFGYTSNNKGFKVLEKHIRLIYGDAINRERTVEIPSALMDNGFSVENMTFGIGSYSYQLISRDSLGYAIKAIDCIIDGEELPLFKDPKTDDGTKKSHRGCVAVYRDDKGEITVKDGLTFQEAKDFEGNLLRTIFKDSKVYNFQTLNEIRQRLHGS